MWYLWYPFCKAFIPWGTPESCSRQAENQPMSRLWQMFQQEAWHHTPPFDCPFEEETLSVWRMRQGVLKKGRLDPTQTTPRLQQFWARPACDAKAVETNTWWDQTTDINAITCDYDSSWIYGIVGWHVGSSKWDQCWDRRCGHGSTGRPTSITDFCPRPPGGYGEQISHGLCGWLSLCVFQALPWNQVVNLLHSLSCPMVVQVCLCLTCTNCLQVSNYSHEGLKN